MPLRARHSHEAQSPLLFDLQLLPHRSHVRKQPLFNPIITIASNSNPFAA